MFPFSTCRTKSALRVALSCALVQAVAHSGVFAQGTQLYSTDFNLPNRTPLQDWTAFGATGNDYWYVENERLNTGDGNKYTLGIAWFTYTNPNSTGWLDYTAGVDVVQMEKEGGMVTLAFRWIDQLNHYYASVDVLRRPDTQQVFSQVSLHKVVDGRTVLLNTVDSSQNAAIPDLIAAGNKRMEVVVNGSNLSVLLNGTVFLEAVDTDHQYGTIALGQQYNQVEFDNVIVTSGSGSSAPRILEQAYRVLILEGFPKAMADQVVEDLKKDQFQNVTAEGKPDGTFSVYVGRFETMAEAQAEESRLQSKNYVPISVETFQPGGGLASVRPTPPPASTPRPAVTAVPTATPAATTSLADELSGLERQAKEAEDRGDYAKASEVWSTYIAKAPNSEQRSFGERQKQAAVEKMGTVDVSSTVPGISATDESGGGNTLLYVGIGVGVLLLLGGGAFVMMRKKDTPAPVAKPSSAIPTPVAPKPAAPKAAAPAPAAAPKAEAPKSTPPAPAIAATPLPVAQDPAPESESVALAGGTPYDLPEVDSSARIRPGQVSRKKDSKETSAAVPPVDTAVSPKSSPAVAKPKSSADKTDSGLSLDFLFEEKKDSKGTPSSEFLVPPRPDSNVSVPVGSAVPKPDEQNFFFLQNFEDEKEGDMPRGWVGEYEYANLQVVKDDSSSGKCLRFEKKEGSGSALYSINFPDASGRIIVEFDIRCDDKNKYLLGFYIEKDGNFRQAISTIVHRTNSNSNPTLRLQNESTPYEFGQWSTIKYDLDLPRYLIDGYVDGKPVIVGARMAQAPKLINTFSIRDNLATTGTLLIRNIRVYKAS
ncbi:MAG: hypothetical protein SFY68_15150 [Candidatus Sumerlaeia bacterium]|nr:hypothetical protein [Candidatus Sumerlaeia bacterium]